MFKDAEEKFRTFLKNSNSRITQERFEILNAALSYNGHFGADELFIQMKSRDSGVSRATIYNTLDLLAECKLLTKRNFGDNMNRYENNLHKKKHEHTVCIECGRISEFSSPKITRLLNEISEDNDFEVLDYSFIVYGKCKTHNDEKNI